VKKPLVRNLKALGLGLALFVCAAPFSVSWAAAKHNVFLTKDVNDGVPQNKPTTDFGCSDQIFAVMELRDLPQGKHKLDAIWRDPSGRDREHTKYPFQAVRKLERIWVWLKLHQSPEAAMVTFVNPSAGMDEFIGRWKLTLTLDGKPLAVKEFKVVC